MIDRLKKAEEAERKKYIYMEEREGQSIEKEEEVRDEAHKRAQSGLQKSESASANEMCVEAEKKEGGGRRKEKKSETRVLFVYALLSCYLCAIKEQRGVKLAGVTFVKKFTSVFPVFWL